MSRPDPLQDAIDEGRARPVRITPRTLPSYEEALASGMLDGMEVFAPCPIADRPAHKGYPNSLNLLGTRIADIFGVPLSLSFAMDQAGRYRRRAEERLVQNYLDEVQEIVDQVAKECTAKLAQMIEEAGDG